MYRIGFTPFIYIILLLLREYAYSQNEKLSRESIGIDNRCGCVTVAFVCIGGRHSKREVAATECTATAPASTQPSIHTVQNKKFSIDSRTGPSSLAHTTPRQLGTEYIHICLWLIETVCSHFGNRRSNRNNFGQRKPRGSSSSLVGCIRVKSGQDSMSSARQEALCSRLRTFLDNPTQ